MMTQNEPGSVLMTIPRIRILEELDTYGPLTIPEIPHQWPFTRRMLELMVDEMVATGLIEAAPSGRIPGKKAYSLTAEGRAIMAPAPA